MDIDTIRNWAGTLALLISAASVILVWVKSPGEAVARRLKEVSDSLKGHDRRIQAVEHEIKHLPTSDDFRKLQITVTKLEGDMKRIEEGVGLINHTVRRIDDYLRENR